MPASARPQATPPRHESVTLHGLRAAAGFIRRQLGDALPMRKLPTLEFQLDHSIKREAEVLAALERERQEREEREQDDEGPAGGEPGA